jgi:glyoxylase-like metal-dependent hydrolase (beta-lactamase superfamily II)
MGPRWSDKERARYGLTSLVDYDNVLAQVGLSNSDVDHVVISHMHFDHIGGAVIERNGKLVPTFPKAVYHVQKGEWELAHHVNARGKASYRPDDFLPLKEHGQLDFMDGKTEIVPGVVVHVTGGHTSHHQIVAFESKGQKGIYFADILPTKSHISPPWVMGYDHFPLDTCDAKSKWLVQAAAEKWLVVFDHELEVPWGHISQGDNGKFDWAPLPADTLSAARSLV